MRKPLRLLPTLALTGVLFVGVAPQSATPALPACTAAQLVPQVGATMVNQGVGSYASTGYRLVRAKETLVRFFLVNQSAVGSTCTGTTNVKSANLTVKNAAGATLPSGPISAYQSFGSSGTAIPSATVQVDSNADPKFVVPANFVNSCLVDLSVSSCNDSTAGFSLTFTASIVYSTSASSSGTLSPTALTAAFDKSTNAFRVLAIPMGDKAQTYSTQFSDSARVATENGFATLSRIYPVAGGVSSTLNTTTGGIRYKLDLAAMLDLKSVSGAYDGSSPPKFCGNQANFDGIKGLLAGFLSVYNSSITNTSQRADRVLGVVDKNISDGSTSVYNCAEGMAATNAPEAWVRAIPDQAACCGKPAVPSMTGALMGMELSHTFGMDTTLSFHSANTSADLTAPDRAYNVSSRSYLADDRSTMHFASTNPFNNNSALFERDDFEHMLCNLGGSLATLPGTTTSCPTAALAGTIVAAGPTFAIFGTTDFTQAGTNVLESYKSDDDPIFASSADTKLQLQFFDSSGNHINGDVNVPYSTKTSEHDATTNLNTTNALFGGVFDAPAGYTTVKLVDNGTVLYQRSSTGSLDSVSAGIGQYSPGGSLTIDKTLTTTAIPPLVDICLDEDETGSFGDDIATLKKLTDPSTGTLIPALDKTGANYATCVLGFRDFAQDGWGAPGDWLYKRYANVTAGGGGFTSGVSQLTAGGGNDNPEGQLESLHYLATPSHAAIDSDANPDTTSDDTPTGLQPTWRDRAKRVVLLATDAECHVTGDPATDGSSITWPGDSGTTSADTTAGILKDAGITVISLVPDATSPPACAATLARVTGGSVQSISSDSSTVVSGIMAGLGNLPVTVQPQVTSCSPYLTLLFDGKTADQAAKTVTSGDQVSWTETANISARAPAGSTLACTVQFLVDGTLPSDPAFVQSLSLELNGARNVVATFESPDAQNLRAHVIYDCGNGEKEPAFVALQPKQVASNIATFQQGIDPSLSCANVTGTASLTIVGTDGVDTASETVPTSPSTLPVANKPPSAAIYQPSIDGAGSFTSPFALNGHVADPEDGNLTAHWRIVSGPVKPSIPDGDVVDVAPPAGGWPEGDYVIQLSGTDSKGATGTAQVTVHVKYAFLGFFSPIENPPTLNMGRAGNTYPLKWSLKKRDGTFVSDLSVVVALRYAPIECPAGAPTDTIDTVASGGSMLRYDTKTNQYIYNWTTPSTPGCYMVTLYLNDGGTHVALFQLK